MKLRHVDFKNLIYPVRLSFEDDDGIKSELVLVGILVPAKEVYAGVPIMYCTTDMIEIKAMPIPAFIKEYGNMDLNLFLGGK